MAHERVHPKMASLITKIISYYNKKYKAKLTRTEASRIIAENFNIDEFMFLSDFKL